MAFAVNRTGVIRPQSVKRRATATHQSTCPSNTIDKGPGAVAVGCLAAIQLSWAAPGTSLRLATPVIPGWPVIPVAPVAPLAASAGS